MSAHPIDPFLDAWASRGGHDGPDLRLRVYAALTVMPSRDELADTLRAVLAWSADDRVRFDGLFTTFFRESIASRAPEGLDVAAALTSIQEWASKAPIPVPKPIPVVVEPFDKVVLRASIVLVALGVAAVGGAVFRTRETPVTVNGGPVVVHDAAVDVVSDVEVSRDAAVDTAPAVAVTAQAPAPTFRDRLTIGRLVGSTRGRAPWWFTLALSAGASGALASLLSRLREERRARRIVETPKPLRELRADTPASSEPDYRSHSGPKPINARGGEALAWAAGFGRSDEARELDLRRTVHQSARRLGIFSPVYRARAVTSAVKLVLPARLDAVAEALVAGVVRALVQCNVPVEVARGARDVAGAELVLVFVDARNPSTVPLRRWWRHPRVAAVELRDPWLWGEEVETLTVEGKPVRVHAPTIEGIMAALLAASRGVRGEASRRVREDDDTEHVGAAFPLAAACALCEPCDLATIDALRRRFTPELPFVALQRIAVMEGVHRAPSGWTFERALRDHLVSRVGRDFREEVLAWQAQRLAEITATEGTLAAALLTRERALVEMQRALVVEDAGTVAKVVRALEAEATSDEERARLHERVVELGGVGPSVAAEVAQGRDERVTDARVGWRRWAIDAACASACAMGAVWSVAAGGVVEARTRTCPEGTVLVPAGEFLMGSADSDTLALNREKPQHRVRMSAFCIDRTEVTVAQYRAWSGSATNTPGTEGACNWDHADRDAHPINCVDWNQASAFCAAQGGSLPTEAQWEYAARGSDGRVYPWGDTAPRDQLCWSGGERPREGTCEVGSIAGGSSPFGLDDMAGNVWEWTAGYNRPYRATTDPPIADPGEPPAGSARGVRGAAWFYSNTGFVRAANRLVFVASSRSDYLGFRCVRGSR